MTAPEVLLALYLIRALHEPAWLAGVLFAVNTAVVAVGQTALSRIVAHLPPVRMLRLTAVVWTAGFAGFWLAGMLPRAAVVAGLFAAVLICTAAEMIQGPAMNDLVVASAPDHARGRYLGVYQLSWGLGRAVAPAVLTGLFAVSAGLPWLVLAAGCAGCAIALRSGRLSHLARQSADAPPAPGGV
jgi:MFS family permease